MHACYSCHFADALQEMILHERQFTAFFKYSSVSVQICKLGSVLPLAHTLVANRVLSGSQITCRFKAGAAIFSSDGLNYLGNPGFVHAQSIIATLGVQVHSQSPGAPIAL